MRYVRKDTVVYDHAHCCLCGVSYGGGSAKAGHKCAQSVCMACGSPQCHMNGLGRGQCSICYVGLLPGWSGNNRPCGYANCKKPAVAAAPRVRFCCADHLSKAKLDTVIAGRIANITKEWKLVPDGTNDTI